MIPLFDYAVLFIITGTAYLDSIVEVNVCDNIPSCIPSRTTYSYIL